MNATSPSTVIIVANAIMNTETLSGVQQKIMVEKLLQKIQSTWSPFFNSALIFTKISELSFSNFWILMILLIFFNPFCSMIREQPTWTLYLSDPPSSLNAEFWKNWTATSSRLMLERHGNQLVILKVEW